MSGPINCTTYTSRLIKASALLSDTKTLLGNWDLSIDVQENLARARQLNIFGKASRSRVENILVILRQRYFDDPGVGRALAGLVQAGVPSRWLDPLFYYYSVQNDVTLRAIVLEVVYARRAAGHSTVHVDQVIASIGHWVTEGKTTSAWGQKTILRVAQNAMAALRDFGVLSGSVNKTISPLYLPIETFAFLALDLQRRLVSGDLVLRSPEWQLFFLTTGGVERFFVEAHQEHLLSYHAAGPVVRLEFPASTLEAYAHALEQRARSFEGASSVS